MERHKIQPEIYTLNMSEIGIPCASLRVTNVTTLKCVNRL